MDEFTFEMGRERISVPADRLYARSHMWCRSVSGPARMDGPASGDMEDGPSDARDAHGATVWQVGFTAFAITLIRDVFFLDWQQELAGTAISAGQELGSVESAKAVSSIHSPLAGRLRRFNLELLDDPSLLNADCYGRGWLFELESSSGGDLMSPADYLEFLHEAWADAQRKLKRRFR